MAAILGLAAGRRIAFASEIPIKYVDVAYTVFLPDGPKFDSGLYGPMIGDDRARVVQIMSALTALPEQQTLALGSAIRMRNAACCIVESDYSSAYGLLIAAIEALSGTFRGLPISWEAWEKAEGCDTFMSKELSLSKQDPEQLRQRLLKDKHLWYLLQCFQAADLLHAFMFKLSSFCGSSPRRSIYSYAFGGEI